MLEEEPGTAAYFFVIIQHPKIIVRIQDEVLTLRTNYNSYLGADKAHSASGKCRSRQYRLR